MPDRYRLSSKPCFSGPHVADAAEVPLADVRGLITGTLQHFGDGHFRWRHAVLFERLHRIGFFAMHDQLQGTRVVLRHRFEDRHADFEERRELEAEPRRISAGHDRRARRRAYRVCRVTVGECHAVVADRIDVRSLQRAVGRTAVVERHVVEAHVVGHDDDDVRRTSAGGLSAVAGPWLHTTSRFASIGSRRSAMRGAAASINSRR